MVEAQAAETADALRRPEEVYPMASYQKYVMMGVTIILVPLGKMVLQKLVGKFTPGTTSDQEALPPRRDGDSGFRPALRREYD